MAQVLPFPLALRRPFVWRQASYMARLGPRAAEEHLQRQVAAQRATMLARGVSPALADQECAAGAAAVRGALCSLAAQGGHVA